MRKFVLVWLFIPVMIFSNQIDLPLTLKEYDDIELLSKDLVDQRVLNYPKVVFVTETFEDVGEIIYKELVMNKPLVDVVLHSSEYGDIILSDSTLRYIMIVSEYKHFHPSYIIKFIQHENYKANNPCITGNDVESFRAIEKRMSWAYRVRAFGYPEEYIFLKYKELPNDFFE
jgi:ribosomal protein S17